jgi:Tfp pilus assembly protein PilF
MELMAELSPLDQALPLLRKVVEISPQNGGALNNLAFLLARRDQPKEALPFAARAADIARGKNGPVLDTYGWVLFLLGQYAEACPNLERAAALMPAQATVTYHLGVCYLKSGRTAEGKSQLERALTLKPDPETAAAIRRAM